MPGKSLLIVLLITVILTGCATSQLRVIQAPTEAPVQPTVKVGSDYPPPGSNETVSKGIPTRIRMHYLPGNRNTHHHRQVFLPDRRPIQVQPFRKLRLCPHPGNRNPAMKNCSAVMSIWTANKSSPWKAFHPSLCWN